jgi:hypothetical protein
MKKVLAFAATSEAVMSLVSLVYPSIAVRLLFGSEIAGAGVVMGRIAGISLVALGLACWPGSDGDSGLARALRGMLCYSLLATLFLAYLGIGGEYVGSLLWPVVALHVTLTFLLAGAWLRDQQTKGKKASLA